MHVAMDLHQPAGLSGLGKRSCVPCLQGGLVPHYADPITLLAMYLSAVVHDYEHAGLTNDFLVNSSHMLAIRYNDKSPLENHHLAAAFADMKDPQLNFTRALSKPTYDKMCKVSESTS